MSIFQTSIPRGLLTRRIILTLFIGLFPSVLWGLEYPPTKLKATDAKALNSLISRLQGLGGPELEVFIWEKSLDLDIEKTAQGAFVRKFGGSPYGKKVLLAIALDRKEARLELSPYLLRFWPKTFQKDLLLTLGESAFNKALYQGLVSFIETLYRIEGHRPPGEIQPRHAIRKVNNKKMSIFGSLSLLAPFAFFILGSLGRRPKILFFQKGKEL